MTPIAPLPLPLVVAALAMAAPLAKASAVDTRRKVRRPVWVMASLRAEERERGRRCDGRG